MGMTRLSSIEGIGNVYAAKLEAGGIESMEELLEVAGPRKGRKELAENAGISEKLILAWVNRADLSRIRGISTQYADLLESAGVDTVPELSHRNPENLLEAMARTNEEKNLVRKLPALSQVQDWIGQAKELPREVHY
jgi:predicted flap endonuclease-1-like 5' DNA nuclease